MSLKPQMIFISKCNLHEKKGVTSHHMLLPMYNQKVVPFLTHPELHSQTSFLTLPIMLTAVTRVSPIDQAVL